MKKSILTILCGIACVAVLVSCKTKQNSAKSPSFSLAAMQGEWDITLPGQLLKIGQVPVLIYNAKENLISVKTGCNSLGGSPSFGKKEGLSMGNMMSTMMMCPEPEMKVERSIIKALNSAKNGKVTAAGIELLNNKNEVVLTLNKPHVSLLTGEWNVVMINGQDVPKMEETPFFNLDAATKKIFGSTGCNRMNGVFSLSVDNARKIVLGNMATTRRACMGDGVETELLKAMGEVVYFKVTAEALDLLNKNNQTVISCVKAVKK